jgi:hypothetical protein
VLKAPSLAKKKYLKEALVIIKKLKKNTKNSKNSLEGTTYWTDCVNYVNAGDLKKSFYWI